LKEKAVERTQRSIALLLLRADPQCKFAMLMLLIDV